MQKKTFKEIFNEIGWKYQKANIDRTYANYNTLCLIATIAEEGFYEGDVKEEMIKFIAKLQRELEELKFDVETEDVSGATKQ